jgi:uncharacterized protein YjiS (DUF1127 family)
MSATIPLPPRAALAPYELYTRAGGLPSNNTPAQVKPVGALLAALNQRLQGAWTAWRQRRRMHATRVALMQLNDATLRDIGFVRAEIESVAAEADGGVAATRARLLRHVGPIAH